MCRLSFYNIVQYETIYTIMSQHIDGSIQNRRNCSMLAIELQPQDEAIDISPNYWNHASIHIHIQIKVLSASHSMGLAAPMKVEQKPGLNKKRACT